MKKFISVLLALTLVFTMALPAFAKTKSEEYPVIIVRGIDMGGLTHADGTPAMKLGFGDVLPFMVMTVLNMVLSFHDGLMLENICRLGKKALDGVACDENGNSKHDDVSMVTYEYSIDNYPELMNKEGQPEFGMLRSAAERVGAENTYYFTYDWRLTPKELADNLDEMVRTAKAHSHKDKVNIMCASMGGMITNAYFYYYGSDSVNSAVFLSGAQNGGYIASDLLNGDIVFSSEILKHMILTATGHNIFLDALINVFDAIGVFEYLEVFLNAVIKDQSNYLNDHLIRDTLGTCPGVWALCAKGDLKTGVQKMFGGREDDYALLLRKLDETDNVLNNTTQTLKKAKAEGVKMSFVSNYNRGLVPFYKRADNQGDSLLETKLTSNFATVAKVNQILPESLIASRDPQYISSDKVIDASTCTFPESTWFVKNAPHVACEYGSTYSDFAFTLLLSDTQPTVHTYESYPRFMYADFAQNVYPY